ncbi:Transposase, type 1 [Popillia japonica]|uniref:Transposase, type 1 n=1 Tax=Popillia japonica TaxID=7064 RepID=A0AAW1IV96_POPJA
MCARWVPRMLTEENKRQRKEACEQLLDRYRHEGDEFLFIIVTRDESWTHHYDPEEKRQSMEYRYRNSPKPKKFKTTPSANKVLLTVSWDARGPVMMGYLEKRCTANSERYIQTLQTLRKRVRRVRCTSVLPKPSYQILNTVELK